jgi:nickel superoxide dismutase
MKPIIALVAAIALMMSIGSPAFAHCEIPCGIYDDEARIAEIAEHITTIEKSMNQIISLSKEKSINYNQIVRWVDNKENHASELQHIVTQYFMTQRIKPFDKEEAKPRGVFARKLGLLHGILFYSMKAKQTTDLDHVEKLRSLLADFRTVYFGKK